MCIANSSIDVHYRSDSLSIIIDLRLYYPHSCIFAWMVTDWYEPLYKRTRVHFPIVLEREKQANASNIQAAKARESSVLLKKDTIISWFCMAP